MSITNLATVINSCRAAQGGGSKAVIQDALSRADEVARQLIVAALDPYRTYGIRQFDMPKEFGDCQDISIFFKLLTDLENRDLTGNAAREAVEATLAMYDAPLAGMLACVLDKDFRAGFSAETANKVWTKAKYQERIPLFDVMLADKCDETEDFEKFVTFPCQADWKYDGCLSAEWTIDLKDGRTVTIGEFVDQEMEGEVRSYNTSTKKEEWRRVQARVKNSMPERKYEWFRLTLEDGTVLPPLTGNHRIWIPNLKVWRRVDELQVDDLILACKYHRTSSEVIDGNENKSEA